MKRALIVVGVLLGMGALAVQAVAGEKKTTTAAPAKPSCGAMMKQLAALPAKFTELMTAVADGQAGHAAMLTGKDAASTAEAAALKKISQDHRDLATAAKKAQTDMEAAGSLAPVPNEPKPDAKALEQMQKTAALEKEMAAMMVKHAEDTEKMIAQMKGATPASAK
jgi:hypothetical protein